MAAIDKTYLTNWTDYMQLYDWCVSVGTVIDDWGNEFTPLDYLWKGTKEEWLEFTENETSERPVWATSLYLDIYLIRYCPIEFIQERLKEQYGEGWSKTAFCENSSSYNDIKNKTSVYDTYVRNGVTNPKFKWDLYTPMKNVKDIVWWVQIKDSSWNYDETADYWYNDSEVYTPKGMWTSNTATLRGKLTKRSIARKLKKWNLPKGTVLQFSASFYLKNKPGRYTFDGHDFDLQIR